MKNLKIASIFILTAFTMSFMVSGVSAAKMDANWQFHTKIVKLNDTITLAPSGAHIPEVSFDAQYNKNYLKLVSGEGFTFKPIKPGITLVNIICTPWYHILIYPPVDRSTITDTYTIIIKK